MSDDEREPQSARYSDENNRAWQDWRAQLADLRASLDAWRVESAVRAEQWERRREEAQAKVAAAEAEVEEARAELARLQAAYELDTQVRAWRRATGGRGLQ